MFAEAESAGLALDMLVHVQRHARHADQRIYSCCHQYARKTFPFEFGATWDFRGLVRVFFWMFQSVWILIYFFFFSYDVALLLVQLPVCYYGERGLEGFVILFRPSLDNSFDLGHKGRWLTAGMFLMAIGSLVCRCFLSQKIKSLLIEFFLL